MSNRSVNLLTLCLGRLIHLCDQTVLVPCGFITYLHEGYVDSLGFQLATRGSAVRRATDFAYGARLNSKTYPSIGKSKCNQTTNVNIPMF